MIGTRCESATNLDAARDPRNPYTTGMRNTLTLIAVCSSLAVACGGNSTDAHSGTGGASHGQAGSLSGGAPSAAGAANGGGGRASGAGGTGDLTPTAGSFAVAGQPGATSGSGGAASGGAASGGAASSTAGTGGSVGGSGGSGGTGATTGCTRELLKATAEVYFKALVAHAPTLLPLADGVKHTENGKASKLGEAGLWKSPSELRWSRKLLDTEACQVASVAVVQEDKIDLPVALRLKLDAQRITESELIVVRAGDYSTPSDPIGFAGSDFDVKWEKVVPDDMRNTQAEFTSWATKYYAQFPNGMCDTSDTCKRLENGSGSYPCTQATACGATGPITPVLKTRLVLVDEQAGLGMGFTLFTGGYTAAHLFKMYGGRVYGVSAVLAKAASSGWE